MREREREKKSREREREREKLREEGRRTLFLAARLMMVKVMSGVTSQVFIPSSHLKGKPDPCISHYSHKESPSSFSSLPSSLSHLSIIFFSLTLFYPLSSHHYYAMIPFHFSFPGICCRDQIIKKWRVREKRREKMTRETERERDQQAP